MSALNFPALLWLLFAVPVILFLYLLKMKRRDQMVSSVLLWNRLLKDVQANTPFQKLRRNLLLFLQLLLVILLALALARPFVRVPALAGKTVALVIDGSASMRATDVPGSRFEEARRNALRLVDGMGQGDTAMVILAGTRARPLCPLTHDRNALRAALQAMQPGDGAASLPEALRLATSLLAQRRDAEVILLTDGAFDRIEGTEALSQATDGADSAARGARLRLVKIGQGGNNVGITALDVRRGLGGNARYQAFTQVRNFAPEARRFTLELFREESLVDAREVSLESGAAHGEVFNLPEGAAGTLRARLDVTDDLAVDNSALVLLQPRRQVNVLLVSAGNLFLEKALNAIAGVSLAKTDPGASVAASASRYDLIVLDGKAPAGLPEKGRFLFIGTGGSAAPVTVSGRVQHPSILDWERRHPVTRFLDLSDVRIAEALAARPLPWGQTLAEGESGPLLVAGEKEGLRSLFLGFDLTRSDLPLRVAFPMLLANAVDWLMDATARQGTQWRVGEVVATEVPSGIERVEITAPDGSRHVERVEQTPFLFAATERVGLYHLSGRAGDQQFRAQFAVNLLDEAESDIRPRDQVRVGSTLVRPEKIGAQKAPREVWRFAALLAVGLLAGEWYAFHRRL